MEEPPMLCPNNCETDYMETELYGGIDPNRYSVNQDPTEAYLHYHCDYCGFEAVRYADDEVLIHDPKTYSYKLEESSRYFITDDDLSFNLPQFLEGYESEEFND